MRFGVVRPLGLVAVTGLLSSCNPDRPLPTEGDLALASSSASTPTAPSSLAASAVSSSEIDLSWQDNSTSELGFEVHRSTGGTSGQFTPLAKTGVNVTRYSDPGLGAGSAYCYKVRALGKRNVSTFSNTSCATTPAPTPPPSTPLAPSRTRGRPWGPPIVNVMWDDNSLYEDGFRVQRSRDAGVSWTTIKATPPNEIQMEDWEVEVEQEVCYRVVAFDGGLESAPSETFCTAIPTGAASLVATAVDHQTVDLVWGDVSAFEDGYVVMRGDAFSGGEFYDIAYLPANSRSYRDTGLNSGEHIAYQIRSLKGDWGWGGFSNQVYLVTPAPP